MSEETHMLRRLLVLLAAFGLAFAVAIPAGADSGDRAPLTWFFDAPALDLAEPGDVGSPVGTSAITILERDGDELWFRIRSRDLAPGNAYTVWAVVWNDPSECTDPIPGTGSLCGEGDLGNAAAGSTVMWSGLGGVANAGGNLHLRGHLEEGDPPGEVFFGPGLTDAAHAEVHFIVRCHGPASDDPEVLEAQITTFDGACDTYECGDVQASIHVGTANGG
jgi:hypothetical protein